MTTATQSIEDILRPLAERMVDIPPFGGTGRIPDPRFQALRCVHVFGSLEMDPYGFCNRCDLFVDTWPRPVGIDASLEAILQTIQVCGIEISLAFIKAPKDHPILRDTWLATWPWNSDRSDHVYAETAQEAAAKALVAAVGT